MQPLIVSGQETEIVEAANGVWALQEKEVPYGKETGLKSVPWRLLFNDTEIDNVQQPSTLLW